MLNWIKSNLLELLNWIVAGAIDMSYWICLIVAIIALILYVAGIKKSGKWVSGSIVIYIIMQLLKVAILSVQ
ncbi:hypothetical protein [uncultured Clostridium sp.]|uniref:hypothetical protein n=1 Tax=uncultured Clostridium sp. TaxID=59620 RepID=UPI0026114376|nr:hypothetical protein [uncultured Clostridium sp.]